MKQTVRDVIIGILALGLMANMYVLYQTQRTQSITNRSSAEYDLQLITQIKQLRDCIDQNTRPCTIGTLNQ